MFDIDKIVQFLHNWKITQSLQLRRLKLYTENIIPAFEPILNQI